jgi:hypothetical protein
MDLIKPITAKFKKDKSDETESDTKTKLILEQLEKRNKDKEKLSLNRWETIKLGVIDKIDPKDSNMVTTEIIIKSNNKVLPIIHFFLSEIAEIGIEARHQTLPCAEFDIKKNDIIDFEKAIKRINALSDLIESKQLLALLDKKE